MKQPLATPETRLTPDAQIDGGAFYQARISLFSKVILGLTSTFFVLHNALDVWAGYTTPLGVFTSSLNQWHLLAALLSLLLWQVTRLARFQVRTLRWLDSGGSVAFGAAYALMGSTAIGAPARGRFELSLTLIYIICQMTRAVIVPSTVRRTALICLVAALPLLAVTFLLIHGSPGPESLRRALHGTIYVSLWCLIGALPASLASKVIYVLRAEVREARQLGQYTLEELIAEGGMGTVYRASHALLRRPTAIKLLRAQRTNAEALLRFEREVQLTSRLTHPNTVAIYDYGRTADGVFYYAMEYLDGLDLQRIVELDGSQGPARVVHILMQVCLALREAHGRGLVHRDIKPANIIMCERGSVEDVAKVVDFGLAKSLVQSEANPLSGEHTIVGTPYFLAPEAIHAPQKTDPRSDLYALGAVGYFLLTKTQVFEGRSVMEVCGHHLCTDPTPPSQRTDRPIPAPLEALILRCLEKNPERRPQSAGELYMALQECGSEAWSELHAKQWWKQMRVRLAGMTPSMSEATRAPTLLDVDVHGRIDARHAEVRQ